MNHRREKVPIQIDSDTLHEVLVRLPVKSIARNRCVSKSWNSTFRENYFTDAFFKRSSSRPKFLFSCLKNRETLFLSSPYAHEDPQEDESFSFATFHMTFPANVRYNVCRPVRGLVCGLNQEIRKRKIVSMPWVCNPSTGESFPLPRVRTRKRQVIMFLGYDPRDSLFKILSMSRPVRGDYSAEHQVLKLENGKKRAWKMINCSFLHDPFAEVHEDDPSRIDGICINGIFYYLAEVNNVFHGEPVIVCFDFQTEIFSYIERPESDLPKCIAGRLELTLVNHQDKLAYLKPIPDEEASCIGIQLRILQDAETHQWLTYQYILPPPINDIFREVYPRFLGTTSVGEIVMGFATSWAVFLRYYSPGDNTIRRVRVKEMATIADGESGGFSIFLDHVEDVKVHRLT